ncbi:MAG: YjbQ family protein [Methanobacteriota archaeon]|nr:MAG: YjbQ family protein [Euryarchaeota archaeon]
MASYQERFSFKLSEGEVKNIDVEINKAIEKSAVRNGICSIFAIGSTAAIITTEYEEGHIKDLLSSLELIAPSNKDYEHHKAWHDDNGRSHVRAAFLQQDLTMPVSNGKLVKGTWQNICLINLDTRDREREIIVTIVGE